MFVRLARRLGMLFKQASLVPAPPALASNFDQARFAEFMRAETHLFSPGYAQQRVRIHGDDNIAACRDSGGVLAFLHCGSFFMAGGALTHQRGLRCRAMVTGRNFATLAEDEAAFWRGVHARTETFYGTPLIRTGEAAAKEALDWLAGSGFLIAALDVREFQTPQKEAPCLYQGQTIYLGTGPARLARRAKRPMIPMSIIYDVSGRCHDLYIGTPAHVVSPEAATQAVLTAMEPLVAPHPNQFHHDLIASFSHPHVV